MYTSQFHVIDHDGSTGHVMSATVAELTPDFLALTFVTTRHRFRAPALPTFLFRLFFKFRASQTSTFTTLSSSSILHPSTFLPHPHPPSYHFLYPINPNPLPHPSQHEIRVHLPRRGRLGDAVCRRRQLVWQCRYVHFSLHPARCQMLAYLSRAHDDTSSASCQGPEKLLFPGDRGWSCISIELISYLHCFLTFHITSVFYETILINCQATQHTTNGTRLSWNAGSPTTTSPTRQLQTARTCRTWCRRTGMTTSPNHTTAGTPTSCPTG